MHPRTNYLVTITITLLTLVVASGYAADKDAFSVRTVYKQAGVDRWTQTVDWNFVPGDENRCQVFRSGDAAVQMVLGYDADGRLAMVDDQISHLHIRTLDPNEFMVMSWGHPIPFDDLNPTSGFQGSVKLTKTIDQTRFVYLVDRKITSLSVADAVDAGMIDPDRFSTRTDTNLTVITISYQNELLVRQLWLEGDSWWLFEETGLRRSWRLPSQTQN